MIHAIPTTIPVVAAKPATGPEMAAEDAKQLQALKQRDREVRAHEQAHAAAGGRYVLGGPSFSYQRGPDGRQYAVGGEVQIDTAPVAGDPQATLQKMQQVQRAAMAPSEPSTQDRRVAAQAAAAAAKARSELQKSAADHAQDTPPMNAYGAARSDAAAPGSLLNTFA